MVMADKGYCSKDAQNTIKARGCHSGAILKKNMKEKIRIKASLSATSACRSKMYSLKWTNVCVIGA
jgi:hypothetical protein